MKPAALTSLEPWLLLRARRLAAALPVERRARVAELCRASELRQKLARGLREPEHLPAALLLAKEALALSASALVASRGELSERALSPARAAELPELELGHDVKAFLQSDDPFFADALGTERKRALLLELEAALARLRALYEPRSVERLAVVSMLRVALSVAAIVLSILAYLAVTVRPS